jgi:hypothetical protein
MKCQLSIIHKSVTCLVSIECPNGEIYLMKVAPHECGGNAMI